MNSKKEWNFIASPNFWKGRKVTCDVLVYHYTAGGSLSGTVKYFQTPGLQASAHFVIGRDGEIIQLVNSSDRSWHAGVSTWKERNNVNNFSIGIEICNWGHLTKKGESLYCWTGDKFDGEYFEDAVGNCWEKYPEGQINAVIELTKSLLEEFPDITVENIVGHEHIAPGRKVDPGPAFPWNGVKAEIQKWLTNKNTGLTKQLQPVEEVIEIEKMNENKIIEELSKRSGNRRAKTDWLTIFEYSLRGGRGVIKVIWDWFS